MKLVIPSIYQAKVQFSFEEIWQQVLSDNPLEKHKEHLLHLTPINTILK